MSEPAEGRPITKTISELSQPHSASLLFTPHGLGGGQPPEHAARYLQEMVLRWELALAVPEAVLKRFQRLQLLHAYGLFQYDFFTMADEAAHLLVETALGERFLEYTGRHLWFVRATREAQYCGELGATTYHDVAEAMRGPRRKAEGDPNFPFAEGWRVVDVDTGDHDPDFNGGLHALYDWARRKKLLTGQRSRRIEPLIRKSRNRAAHPHHPTTVMPVDSARTIAEVAETINMLWGRQTPGGRLYPAPIDRELIALGRRSDGGTIELHASQLADINSDHRDDEFVLLLGYWLDELREFQLGAEMTAMPCQLIWGPGSFDAAQEALKTIPLDRWRDSVSYIDRVFLVPETAEGPPQPPRSPRSFLEMGDAADRMSWQVVIADLPFDALGHVAHVVREGSDRPVGWCEQCAVEVLGAGLTSAQAAALLSARSK